jgi:hypothetical protein
MRYLLIIAPFAGQKQAGEKEGMERNQPILTQEEKFMIGVINDSSIY